MSFKAYVEINFILFNTHMARLMQIRHNRSFWIYLWYSIFKTHIFPLRNINRAGKFDLVNLWAHQTLVALPMWVSKGGVLGKSVAHIPAGHPECNCESPAPNKKVPSLNIEDS